MAWGAWSSGGLRKGLQDKVVPHIKSGKVKGFLGFNEPDKKEQANMPYKAALKYWPILESLNVPLCSPGCANPEGLNDGTVQGVNSSWMIDFMRKLIGWDTGWIMWGCTGMAEPMRRTSRRRCGGFMKSMEDDR